MPLCVPVDELVKPAMMTIWFSWLSWLEKPCAGVPSDALEEGGRESQSVVSLLFAVGALQHANLLCLQLGDSALSLCLTLGLVHASLGTSSLLATLDGFMVSLLCRLGSLESSNLDEEAGGMDEQVCCRL